MDCSMCHSFFSITTIFDIFFYFLVLSFIFHFRFIITLCVLSFHSFESKLCYFLQKDKKKTKLLFMNLLPYIGIKKEPFIWLTIQTQESRSCTAVLDISIIFSFPNVVLITQKKTSYGFITSLFGIKIHILSLTQQMSRRKQQTKVYHLHMWGW